MTNSIKNTGFSLSIIIGQVLLIILLTANFQVSAQQWSELGGNNGLAANGEILNICSDSSGNI